MALNEQQLNEKINLLADQEIKLKEKTNLLTEQEKKLKLIEEDLKKEAERVERQLGTLDTNELFKKLVALVNEVFFIYVSLKGDDLKIMDFLDNIIKARRNIVNCLQDVCVQPTTLPKK